MDIEQLSKKRKNFSEEQLLVHALIAQTEETFGSYFQKSSSSSVNLRKHTLHIISNENFIRQEPALTANFRQIERLKEEYFGLLTENDRRRNAGLISMSKPILITRGGVQDLDSGNFMDKFLAATGDFAKSVKISESIARSVVICSRAEAMAQIADRIAYHNGILADLAIDVDAIDKRFEQIEIINSLQAIGNFLSGVTDQKVKIARDSGVSTRYSAVFAEKEKMMRARIPFSIANIAFIFANDLPTKAFTRKRSVEYEEIGKAGQFTFYRVNPDV